ncbi:hypothetical protein HJC06_26705 [Rhizobium sp. NLR9b]|uniref:hypothetical protein n=2 Tax=Rhizobium/Agrobacterium group TaxID=227290 RepID=UPI001C840081|nr:MULTISPECIES: hypothetical protein [unclassified Rhizobium]MBX5229966.1 hypothetical protein [Rhizobium sp. NLR9b]MBX5290633.1 hypothetical protein [Rhizobium sp. NLR10b]
MGTLANRFITGPPSKQQFQGLPSATGSVSSCRLAGKIRRMELSVKYLKASRFPAPATLGLGLDRLAQASKTDTRITLKLARLAAAYCALACYWLLYGEASFIMPSTRS